MKMDLLEALRVRLRQQRQALLIQAMRCAPVQRRLDQIGEVRKEMHYGDPAVDAVPQQRKSGFIGGATSNKRD